MSESSPRPPRRMLLCRACGHTLNAPIIDLMGYMKSGWPRCCGEVMTLFVEAERPGVDGTPLEGPALPPDADGPAA